MSQKKTKVRLEHHTTLKDEILCHFPYAIFSVVLSMIIVSFITLVTKTNKQVHDLFHLFHYLHLVFSATGVVLTFRRFSQNKVGALVAGILIPAAFCTLSDMIVPYVGGEVIGLHTHLHWCFIDHFWTVVPFLLIGVINGFVMGSHSSSQKMFYSTGSHFLHILVSSMASILFLVSFGFTEWYSYLAFIFVLLIGAVLVPCTLSDIVVPMVFARLHGTDSDSMPSAGCCLSTVSKEPKEQCDAGITHENDSN